jgi:hypothetical protein
MSIGNDVAFNVWWGKRGGVQEGALAPFFINKFPFPRGRGHRGWGFHIKFRFPEKSKIF